MSSQDHQCKCCQRDYGFCVYCQKQFKSIGNLHRHIQKQHKDTIRWWNCDINKEN